MKKYTYTYKGIQFKIVLFSARCEVTWSQGDNDRHFVKDGFPTIRAAVRGIEHYCDNGYWDTRLNINKS